MEEEICRSCLDPLVIEVEPDSETEDSKQPSTVESIPDDVELSCGCHYHWECFLEAYTITECPNCTKNISSQSLEGQLQVLCTIRNEGGTQANFDILPSATEEAYLRTYPEERRGHAYLDFCREGDIDAIVHLIKDANEDDADNDEDQLDVLRYRGTFEGIEGSGLHVAIRYNQQEVAWLLLALGSSLGWEKFPPVVVEAMQTLNLTKGDRQSVPDIRSLADSEGRLPAALAEQVGGIWSEWAKDGRLGP